MAKSYQMSNNTIFSVNDDGSITKFATITERGEIFCMGKNIDEKSPKNKTWGYWLAIVILAIATIIGFVLYSNADSEYNYQWSRASSLERSLNEERQKTTSLNDEIVSLERAKSSAEEALSMLKQKVGDSYPIIISDIEIANVYRGGSIETDYGHTIYSSRSMYLQPRIQYYGISSGSKTLKVKWYKPDGGLRTGSSSPTGFSQSESCYLYSGSSQTYTLNGWGNENMGHWKAGTYRIEIWYGNTCLKSKTFTIY